MKFTIIIFGLSLAVSSLSEAAKDKRQCSTKELRRQDCHLQYGKIKIQVWNDKIIAHDKVHRTITPLPESGDSVEWKELGLKTLGGRGLLEFYFWGKPETEGEVSSLNWTLYEVTPASMELKLHKVVRRRKAVQKKDGKTTRFEYDKLTPHKIFLDKKTLKWKTGYETGEIK